MKLHISKNHIFHITSLVINKKNIYQKQQSVRPMLGILQHASRQAFFNFEFFLLPNGVHARRAWTVNH